MDKFNIEIPEGFVIESITQNGGAVTVVFRPAPKIYKSKSWDEYCQNHPETKEDYYISTTGKICSLDRDINFPADRKNLLRTKEDAEAILTLIQIMRLHEDWVGTWKPGPKDEMWWELRSPESDKISLVASTKNNCCLLSFKTRETADNFRNCFHESLKKISKFIAL